MRGEKVDRFLKIVYIIIIIAVEATNWQSLSSTPNVADKHRG